MDQTSLNLGVSKPSLPYLIDGETKLFDVHKIMIHLTASYAPELCGLDKKEMKKMSRVFRELE
jgi:hypothetical protein